MGISERREREKDIQQKLRRKQILDAAKKLFYEKGFRAATVEDIAQEAELSPAALYLYFKNKDDLYVSLNFQLLEYLSERLEQLKHDNTHNSYQKIEELKALLYDVFNFDPLILINLFHLQASDGLRSLPADRSNSLNTLAAKCLQSLASIFQEGIDEGCFEEHHPVALADIIWSVFTGAVLWEESKRMINPEKDYLKSTLDLAIDILARGLRRT